MSNSKIVVAASAAVSLLSVAGAVHAATVGTSAATIFSTTTIATPSGGKVTVETASGSGSGTLVSGGTFTLSVTGEMATLLPPTISPAQTLTINDTDTFTGTISGTTFTATAGTTDITSCTGGSDCPATGLSSFSKASGTVSLVAGGTGNLTGTTHPDGGVATATNAWTVGPFAPTPVTTTTPPPPPPPAVPLPPAVWLLGSGLLGLVGTARRRLKTSSES